MTELLYGLKKMFFYNLARIEGRNNRKKWWLTTVSLAFTQSFYPLSENDSEYFQINADGNNNYAYMAENNAILVTNRGFLLKV